MTQGPEGGGLPGSVVLGISVVDDQIASVVRDADGHVLASNLVDLPDSTAQGAEAAIVELVESVPVVVDRIGVSVSREEVRAHLARAFAPATPGAPEWAANVTVTGHASALAEIACTHATRGGVVAVVDLDRDAAPAAGTTLATVDTTTGAVLGTADFTAGQLGPVTDPDGASRLADAIGGLPRGREISSIVVSGPGAEVPGIAPAIEYAAQRPVTVADNPALTSALGAADAAAIALGAPEPAPHRASTGRRWWFVGAAIGAAVFLGAVGLTLIVAAERDTPEPAPVTVTRTPSAVTVTADAKTVTETRTEVETRERTTTVTSTPRPVTRTTTVTESEEPVATVTETTTTTVTVPVPGQAPAYGPGTPGTPGTSGTP
ncbi:Uncharacterised protein [Gordonia paraffinivorans]|uniref:FHA domain-containing protein n=1 Tax=Gordonia paraffinivorans TaxID=175628 RepID=A0ABD7V2E1_9ACTN|nr:hypothetical protein [Gordonia paraffinivorans]VFA88464.1 Uncharacterised protein [Gordonia paraffinivorans]